MTYKKLAVLSLLFTTLTLFSSWFFFSFVFISGQAIFDTQTSRSTHIEYWEKDLLHMELRVFTEQGKDRLTRTRVVPIWPAYAASISLAVQAMAFGYLAFSEKRKPNGP